MANLIIAPASHSTWTLNHEIIFPYFSQNMKFKKYLSSFESLGIKLTVKIMNTAGKPSRRLLRSSNGITDIDFIMSSRTLGNKTRM